MVDVIGHKGCKPPVITAVLSNKVQGASTSTSLLPHLKEVAEWHGGMREAVHKEGLQQSFGIVQSPTYHSYTEYQSGDISTGLELQIHSA